MSHRLTYSVAAAHGKVFLQWSEPVRRIGLPWAFAYALAKALVAAGERAEIQAGLALDRTVPEDIINTVIGVHEGDVKIDWGCPQEQAVFILPPGAALAIANALVIKGEIAQRWGTRGPGLTHKEIEKVEESILGEPTLARASADKRPHPPFVPILKQVYYYRPAESNATVLALFPEDRRANVLLATGRILEGIAWADLFVQKPGIAGPGLGIPTAEQVPGPSLSGGGR